MTADDSVLLERFVANRDEAAFAELVRRYLNLVYFAELRQVGGDAHRAEDVAQNVFTRLADMSQWIANKCRANLRLTSQMQERPR